MPEAECDASVTRSRMNGVPRPLRHLKYDRAVVILALAFLIAFLLRCAVLAKRLKAWRA